MMRSLQLVVVFFLMAMLVGSILVTRTKEKNNSVLTSILYGSIVMLSLFEVLVIPMTIMGQSLSRLTVVWSALIGIIGVCGIISEKKIWIEQIKKLKRIQKNITFLDIIVVVLVLTQVFICFRYIFLHANDAYYVGMAATTLQSDRLFSYSPYTGAAIEWNNYKTHLLASLPAFWAMLAKLFGVSAASMCHTIVPVLYIPIGYILYREIGMLLFKQNKRAVNLFLIIICVGNFFIGKDSESSYEMLSTTIWQGGTFLYQIALPGLFYFEFKLLRKNRSVLDFVMLMMMLVVGIMTVPLTGGILSILLMLVLGVGFGIDKLLTRRKRMDAGINI